MRLSLKAVAKVEILFKPRKFILWIFLKDFLSICRTSAPFLVSESDCKTTTLFTYLPNLFLLNFKFVFFRDCYELLFFNGANIPPSFHAKQAFLKLIFDYFLVSWNWKVWKLILSNESLDFSIEKIPRYLGMTKEILNCHWCTDTRTKLI